MSSTRTTLAGTILQDWILEDLIGEGGYSWVYKGVNKDLVNIRAFKIAKPAELIGQREPLPGETQALGYITGGITEVHPDASQLLALQSNRIMQAEDPLLVNVEEFGIDKNYSFCRMELLEGQTLRSLMNAGPIPITTLIHLARSMERLSKKKDFGYHGDLKPENIIVTEGGVKVIDPGHFGPLECAEGDLDICMITTPEYYPLLTPDDLYALAIIIWEIACRKHPLGDGTESTRTNLKNIGDDLRMWVRQKELIGQYYLSPILSCGRPSELRPGIPAAVEQLCLRSLGLRITAENKLDRGPGFGTYEDLIAALEGLLSENIRQL